MRFSFSLVVKDTLLDLGKQAAQHAPELLNNPEAKKILGGL